jgi:hypothetical protein
MEPSVIDGTPGPTHGFIQQIQYRRHDVRHQHFGHFRPITCANMPARPRTGQAGTVTILSNAHSAKHHNVLPADDSAGQPSNRVFDWYRFDYGHRSGQER